MTVTSTDRDLAGTIFVAINRALLAEGMNDSEAFRLADRGARLLAAPESPQLEAALRAADHERMPPRIKNALDNCRTSLLGGIDRLHAGLDRCQVELDRTYNATLFLLGCQVAVMTSFIMRLFW